MSFESLGHDVSELASAESQSSHIRRIQPETGLPASEVSQTHRSGSKSKRHFGSESTDAGAILRVSERISSVEKAVSWSHDVFTSILRADYLSLI